ncbi:universal stress protein [Planobispora siamensis]|uniref:Universal stress protein n=1 Tax=Planobispora siamensis TaxID=936338 RepID=A0A8J3WPT6_9ACTN|nr:universal stress protein [Planobispora siamensis]GIH95221.1 universal stress protein [Planobispora siamensis]
MAGLIVVGVDGSAPAMAAVEWAAQDAARGGAALKIVHVHDTGAGVPPLSLVSPADEPGGSVAGHAREVLTAAAQRARDRAPGIEITTDLAAGKAVERLKSESERADTLVVGSRGIGGFAGLVLGSAGLGLAGHAAGPVVVVRAPSRTVHDVIVVGFDGSEHSEAALDYAFTQARRRGARLRAVYAWQPPVLSAYALGYSLVPDGLFEESADSVRRRLEPWREKHPDVELEESAVHGHPVPVLSDASRRADLVVVGSHGRGGFGSAVLGSVSHGVLHRAHCPVAVVRPRSDRR